MSETRDPARAAATAATAATKTPEVGCQTEVAEAGKDRHLGSKTKVRFDEIRVEIPAENPAENLVENPAEEETAVDRR